MAISAIISAGVEKTLSIMTEGLQQAAEQSTKGAGFARGGVAAAKTQVSGSVGADVVKEIPKIIKDGLGAMQNSPAMKALSEVPSKLAEIDSGISGKVAGAGIGAAKGVAGKGAAMGKGFSAGMNDLGGALGDLGFVMKELTADGINNPLTRGIKAVMVDAPMGAAKGAARGIGDSKMGQMAGQAMKQGKSMAKVAGVSLSIASLLRQSQLFTGVIGMIFQIIGAFIDILLIPFMPLVTMSMRMVAKLLPPMMKVALFLNSLMQVYADLLEKVYSMIFEWTGKALGEFWKGLNELGGHFENAGKEVWNGFNHLGRIFAALSTAFWDGMNHLGRIIWDDGLLAIWEWVKEKWDKFKLWLDGITPEKILEAWTTAKEWIDENIVQKIDDAITWTGNFFTNIGTAISDGWTTAVEWFQTNIVDKIGAFFTTAGTFFTNIGGTIKDNIVAAWDGIKDFFTSTVPEAIKTAFGFVTTKISAIFDFFATVFAPIGNFVQGVLNKISGYVLSILGFMGNIDRFGIGKAVRGTMGFDDKETFNQMIKASKTELDSQKQSNQIELIIKQEGESAQYAIRAANKQANSFAMKQQQNSELLLADGLPGLD